MNVGGRRLKFVATALLAMLSACQRGRSTLALDVTIDPDHEPISTLTITVKQG